MVDTVVYRADGVALKFDGEVIAEVDNHGSISKRTGKPAVRYMRRRIYRTVGGNYIAESCEIEAATGDQSRNKATRFTRPQEVLEFFGASRATSKLLSQANLEVFELVA